LFYDGLVAAIPAYDFDKHYGGMIVAAPPFNIFVLPYIPVYLCIKDKQRLIKINDYICRILFFPYALIYLFVFTAFDIVMLPFAYFYSLVHKIKLLCMPKTFRPRRAIIFDFFLYLIVGPILMLLNIPGDMYYFMKHIYSNQAAKLEDEKLTPISVHSFAKLEKIVERIQKDMKTKKK